jgi:ubiquinone/menaquinone biosynthesis C-methylase UbiE
MHATTLQVGSTSLPQTLVNIQDAYTHWSPTYDTSRNLTRDLDQAVTRETLSGRRYGSVVEIGCGTGKNTAFLAGLAQTVQALDFSDGMLSRATAKRPPENVIFVRADLTRPWPLAARSAGLVVCNLVLEHIRDLSFIFTEAFRALAGGGQFFICELHPFRQYQGVKANYQLGQETTEIQAFVHHLSDYTDGAERHGLSLVRLREWWHADDQGQPPRLASFLFEKRP